MLPAFSVVEGVDEGVATGGENAEVVNALEPETKAVVTLGKVTRASDVAGFAGLMSCDEGVPASG